MFTGSVLVHVMACRLFGAKSLPEPILAYSKLDSWEQIAVKTKSESFLLKKMHLKLSSANVAAILSRGRRVNRKSNNLAAWPMLAQDKSSMHLNSIC